MMYTPALFLCWRDRQRSLSGSELIAIGDALRAVSGLTEALGFTPLAAPAEQPFAADGRGPMLTLELRFVDAGALTAASGSLRGLADVVSAEPDMQAFFARDFETPDPEFRSGLPCTFLVEYPGEGPEGWLDHYDAHHPPIMVRFPAVRSVATFRPAPEISLDPKALRANSMQRNKVVFDSAAALAAALASPVMLDMRADSAKFAPVSQRPTHFPCATHKFV